LAAISEARVNIKVKEAPKADTTEAAEVSLREEVIPKTLSSIAPRDARSAIDQDIGLRTTQKKSNKRIISDSKTDQGLDT
jgi:hypothetical protein